MTPEQVVRAWPIDTPLASIWAAGPHARWTIITVPTHRDNFDLPVVVPEQSIDNDTPPHNTPPHDTPPFTGGWIGSLGYELGRDIEPAARSNTPPTRDRHWPADTWLRCPGSYAHDARTGQWWITGDPTALPPIQQLLDQLEQATRKTGDSYKVGRFVSHSGEARFKSSVARAVEYIRAGDVFQVNLTHRLSASFTGSTRSVFLDLVRSARPWYGAYIEIDADPRQAILSASPELFLAYDPSSRRVVTRPMKGTRPAGADPAELLASDKDRAELNMIVDLMRNDLGRVCAFGSVRVEHARSIEHHGPADLGVLQTTATVAATLRDDRTLNDLVHAAFPPGSVTGAPKVRAMQIIEQLEPVARGPYCGSIGFISDTGRAQLNVAIRTALVTGSPPPQHPGPGSLDAIADGVIDYHVGAGIVADSTPDAEWIETLDKARILQRISSDRDSDSGLESGT